MAQDTFRKMVEDGRDIIRILESVPEDKRPLLSALAGAFIDGMLAQDRLAAAERERSGPAHEKSRPRRQKGGLDTAAQTPSGARK